MSARFIVADVFDGLAQLEDGSVDLVVTSPPFLALRSYLPADHPDKSKEIGLEPTPAAFIDTLLAVTAELRRVLAPHGSIAIELGDTYAGSGGENHLHERPLDKPNGLGGRSGFGSLEAPKRTLEGWPLTKSKALIPELYRIALAYGINPLTGAESPAGRWRIRNVVTWCRPNPPVGALGDKWRPATSDIVVACTSDKRYWDDIATRRPLQPKTLTVPNGLPPSAKNSESPTASHRMVRLNDEQRGAPLLDWWELPPGGYPGSHYAVYPPALVEPLIKAMAPPKVCRTCGEPSRRITESRRYDAEGNTVTGDWNAANYEPGLGYTGSQGAHTTRSGTAVGTEIQTLGWTDCGHNNWRPALVLDPFAGTGTTLAVATGHGHDAIGIDLDERNYQLALERVGPLVLGPPEKPQPKAEAGS